MSYKNYLYQHKNLGLLFLLIVICFILWGSWIIFNYVNHAYNLPLSKLIIIGERHYTTDDDIRQTVLASISLKTYMNQDINVIQKKIKKIPWIKTVNVSKQWPNTLKIHLVEYVPMVSWNNLYFLDNIGNMFSIPSHKKIECKLPRLYGPEGSELDVLHGYVIINKILVTKKIYIKSLTMSARHSWQLLLNNNICIKLGREHLINRIKRFIKIYSILIHQSKIYNNCISYIDLRYETGLAVGWCKHISYLNN